MPPSKTSSSIRLPLGPNSSLILSARIRLNSSFAEEKQKNMSPSVAGTSTPPISVSSREWKPPRTGASGVIKIHTMGPNPTTALTSLPFVFFLGRSLKNSASNPHAMPGVCAPIRTTFMAMSGKLSKLYICTSVCFFGGIKTPC